LCRDRSLRRMDVFLVCDSPLFFLTLSQECVFIFFFFYWCQKM